MNLFKNALAMSAVILSLTTYSFETTEVNNLQGQFQNGQGTGSVDSWTIPGEGSEGQTSFVLYQESDQFRIQTDESEFLWEGAPDFLLELEKAQWNGVNAKASNQGLNLEVKNLSGISAGDSLLIDRLKANCRGKSQQSDLLFKLIETCSFAGDLSFNKIVWKGSNPFTEGWLNLSNGSFSFGLRAKLDFNVKVKGNGHISVKETSDGGEVWIRLDKVKASFLTVTEKVFEAVEDLQATHIRVQRPYIIIDWRE
ncbi:MAG: hypothetical protein VXV96_18105 [Bdellovibrionota bacterium]|nr:hypothetical protein [Bdellovibrionota bacterium]